MDEDLRISRYSAKKYSMSVVSEDRKGHFKEVALHSLSATDGPSVKPYSSTRRANYRIQQGAVFSGNILSFGCSACKDDSTYSPNDLLKHFQAVHNGMLPTYPCDLCCFVTHEFSVLQRHRIEHKNTLVTCELCSDDVQYSLLLLTRHYIMCHSRDGKFHCDWCEFTTVDAGTFVQHIHHHKESTWKCSKCRHVSLTKADYQKHLKVHKMTVPRICQICGYRATTIKQLKGHTSTSHKEALERTNHRKTSQDSVTTVRSSPTRISKLCGLNGNSTNKPEIVAGSPWTGDNNCGKASFTAEKPTHAMIQQNESSTSSDCGSPTRPNALTVLRVKNKISLPPNCTTKMMGFKMVDGKKHIVLKVIPTSKQDMPSQDNSSVESLDTSVVNSAFDKSENSAGKTSASYSSAVLPISGSSILTEDIVAVKVKVEDEEASVCTFDPPLHGEYAGKQSTFTVNGSSTSNHEASYPTSNNVNHVGSPNSQRKTTFSDIHMLDSKSTSCTTSRSGFKASNTCAGKFSNSPSNVSQELLNDKPTCIHAETSGGADESGIPQTGNDTFIEERKDTSTDITVDSGQCAPSTVSTRTKHCNQNCETQLVNLAMPSEMSSSTILECGSLAQNSLNHKVFDFHNYSKEAFSTSITSRQRSSSMSEVTAEQESSSSSSSAGSSATLEDGHIGEDADDSPFGDENSELVLKDFNVIKIEEEIVPVSSGTKTRSPALGDVEDLDEEQDEPFVCNDSSEPTQATPQVFQKVLMNDQRAMPKQLQATAGFKLITNFVSPQINVSYMKSGLSTSNKSTGGTVPPKGRRIGTLMARGNEKGTALISGVSPSPNHYLINSPILASAAPDNSTDNLAHTQSTCYLVPRSVPLVQATRSAALKLANAKQPLNLKSVLAMQPSHLQNGHQAFLLRYASPSKSGILVNDQEVSQPRQTSERNGNKIIFKIVSPTTGLFQGTPSTSSGHPIFWATTPPSHCFLMSSNKTNANASDSLKKTISVHNLSENTVKDVVPGQLTAGVQPEEADKPILAPRPIRPPSQRKRRRKPLFDELPTTGHKARRLTHKVQTEKDSIVLWNPPAKAVERTLRLAPFSCRQEIKCPRRDQPVVVLNHPDADIPEVANIMKVVHRHKGAVAKVLLSQKTTEALSELGAREERTSTSKRDHPRPVESLVRERFLLRLKLRKKSKKKYEVMKRLSGGRQQSVFECWFCGRLFNSQEDWIGHGQRHLMEATRDWNQLF
ncbi:zinc finger protein 518A [Nerophis ophidion]|uniref:zinc finger protein 518A n=1 Tax=Nerophis ophidion TaxID=159077 RepID=UPI002ADFB8AD|nr:zinc finger protein 518A [Nerophis ophidion]